MRLLEEEKYMKHREEENRKMKEELMRLKLEAQTLTYENRAKAARENQKYTEEQLCENFRLKCESHYVAVNEMAFTEVNNIPLFYQ